MMKHRVRCERRQKGAAMVLALVVLVFGSMAVSGLLYYVSASVTSQARAVDRMEAYYAADAGVEWLAAYVLDGNRPTAGTVLTADSVNNLTPVVVISTVTLNFPTPDVTQYVLSSSAGGATINATIQHWVSANQVRVEIWETT